MIRTDQTLLEQMCITEPEIARRKELLGFTDDDAKLLMSCKALVEEHIDSIVSEFYERQTAVDEIALLIGDADTLSRLHQAQRAYVLSLFEGYYDLHYVNKRLRIGLVHKRIGVEPKLFLAAVKTLKDTIAGALDRHVADKPQLAGIASALEKLLYFDTTLVFDTYIRSLIAEVEMAKNKAMSYAKVLEYRVAERTRQLQELAQRDELTGVYNLRAFRDFVRRELVVAERRAKPLSLVYFDIDEFKGINDANGHQAGDAVLRAVGESLLKIARDIDFPCRYGGDEFCLALPDCEAGDAEKICSRLIEEFSRRVPDVSFSIGIAQAGPNEFMAVDALVRAADRNMYAAKKHPGFYVVKAASDGSSSLR